MFNKDRATSAFYLTSIIIGIIDVLAIIMFATLFTLVYLGVILASKLLMVLAIIVAIINVIAIILIPIYLKFRKD